MQESEQVKNDHNECSVNCVTLRLLYVDRPGYETEN
jgi:hypothetical protein